MAPTMVPVSVLGAALFTHAMAIIALLRQYPPELPGQTYRRTMALHDAWSIDGPHLAGDVLYVTVFNDVSDRYGRNYSQLVQGLHQVPIHQGRWPTLYSTRVLQPTAFRNIARIAVAGSFKNFGFK